MGEDVKYTGYHLFQDGDFQEVGKNARINPYTSVAYDCPHSQRTYLFSHEDYARRTLYDAAGAGGCCDEPVHPFSGKSQYSNMVSPSQSKDCGKPVEDLPCSFDFGYAGSYSWCASGGSKTIPGITITCPQDCWETQYLSGDNDIELNYGSLSRTSEDSVYEVEASYTLSSSTVSNVYDLCLGTAHFTESFCELGIISYTLQAGLDSPGGCGCDCCGVNGKFPAPVSVLSATVNSYEPTYAYSLDLSGTVTVDEACPGGGIGGTFQRSGYDPLHPEWRYPTKSLIWNDYSAYHSNGTTRYVQRQPLRTATFAEEGSIHYNACCGGDIKIYGTNGCGWKSWEEDEDILIEVPRKITNPTFSIFGSATGTRVHSGARVTLTLQDVCADNAWLTVDAGGWQGGTGCQYDCLKTLGDFTCPEVYDPIIGVGIYERDYRFEVIESDECKRCCGHGSATVEWGDGCDSFYDGPLNEETITIGHSLSAEGSGNTVGKVFKCANTGSYYQVQYIDLLCNGSTSGSWSTNPTNFDTIDDCIASIDSGSDATITGFCANGAASGYYNECPDCCHYANNGAAGTAFRARILCVENTDWENTPICCDQDVYAGHDEEYVNNDGVCCP